LAKRRRLADTPLAREFARLCGPTTDRALTTLLARRTVRARELLVWSASAAKIKTTVLLPSEGRTNPIVVGGLVICSVFSPGRIVALDCRTGKRRWVLPLHYYGHSHVSNAPGTELVYAGTSQELLALDPATGVVRWAFCPYGRKGETIYSSPTVAEGRLFVGDRRGYFHCLNANTGVPIWRVHTSRAWNNDVNSDPVVEGGVVAVATNAALALGYDAATGRELWRCRLDGPCGNGRSGGGRTALLRTWRSVYQFTVPDGRLLRRWMLRGHFVGEACAAGELVLLITRRIYGPEGYDWPVSELRAFRGGEQIYTHTYPRWTTPALRYEPANGRVYEATSYGLGILDPETGNREVVIRFGAEDWADSQDQTHPPAVEGGVLYVINDIGRVFALRHP
jgi:outer membrane protein assembly factor BamB